MFEPFKVPLSDLIHRSIIQPRRCTIPRRGQPFYMGFGDVPQSAPPPLEYVDAPRRGIPVWNVEADTVVMSNCR